MESCTSGTKPNIKKEPIGSFFVRHTKRLTDHDGIGGDGVGGDGVGGDGVGGDGIGRLALAL